MKQTVALFGETEKGAFETAYLCRDLADLAHHLGEPPSGDCQGLDFAIQTLLYSYSVIFFRVQEEGYSRDDYLFGLHFLREKKSFPEITAIGLPGVGDQQIIQATSPLCQQHNSLLILTERDLYDVITNR